MNSHEFNSRKTKHLHKKMPQTFAAQLLKLMIKLRIF